MGLSWLKLPSIRKIQKWGKFFPHSNFQGNSLCSIQWPTGASNAHVQEVGL